ncbi:hypothetical protein LB543_01440 [Mesorhizobium sp. ESP7-2]|uniref:hypothetical protein n=1 Tax=Mesorhizobium sp. ESP7-2 TaxID=2876622 RepID=UPI001CCD96DB|nr:hypothetical protein [Mesorhizobium sp. ESP7-2]MBZ9705392.1 hypothetical protein [Mesorhizobium sp. ESP7-2]
MVTIQGLSNPWQAGSGWGGGGVIKLESITRPSAGQVVLQAALAKVPPVDNSGDADFSIGKAARFTVTQPEQKTNPGVTVTWPKDNNQDDEPKKIHIIEYDEVARCWETIRVENPDDKDQYVMVRNTLRVIFLGRDDQLYRAFNLAKADEYK